MAVEKDRSLTIHGEGGRETSTGKRVKKSGSGRKTKKYIGGGTGTRCTKVNLKKIRCSLNYWKVEFRVPNRIHLLNCGARPTRYT
jgi:hypothetical protein